jgi:hypothetical protein
MVRRSILLFTLPVLLSAVGAPVRAANEVPAEWDTLETAHFTFRYHPRAGSRVRPIARQAEEHLAGIADVMGLDSVDPIEVRVARNVTEMAAVKPGQAPPEWAVGMALREQRIILVTLTAPDDAHPTRAEKIFLHEVVHVLEWDATGGRPTPIWFSEGMAIHLSGEFSFERNKVLFAAALRDDLLPLERLGAHYPGDGAEVNVAYAQSADVVKFLEESYGRGFIARLLSRVRRGDEFEPALESLAGSSVRQIERRWRSGLDVWYRWVPTITGGATLWALIAFVLVGAYVRRKREARRLFEKWEQEEEERRRQMSEILSEHWDSNTVPRLSDDRSHVIHEGDTHTLH